ncbi:MAG: BatA domain-containing protein [Planctomycetaceae bacterium]|nr:BatA domain-containing protein [Planctomycetaceae bacterium]
MTFLTASLILGGIAAALIPVVLHWLMQGRPQKYEFPALRFLRRRFANNQRRFRLRRLFLLALRILLFLLIGVALARPALRRQNVNAFHSPTSRESPVAAALIFDTSPRMGYVAANQTRLAEAQELASRLLRQLPKESQAAVLSSQRIPASFQADLLAAQERIDRLTLTFVGRTLPESLAEAVRLLKKNADKQQEIYLFTDLTAASWTENSQSSALAALAEAPDAACYLIDVGLPEMNDTALTRITLSDQILSSETPLRIEAELTHLGKAESQTAELFLKNNVSFPANKPSAADAEFSEEKRGVETAEFSDGISRRQIAFQLSGLPEGIHQGIIRLVSRDALVENDEISFTVEVQPPPQLLIVAPPNARAAFLREALSPSRFRQSGNVPYRIDTISLAQWESTFPKELSKYEAVFLLDPPPIPNTSWRKLLNYADDGKGAAVILGRNADPATFNKDAAQELLGITLQMQARKPDGDVWLTVSDKTHPALKPFQDMDSSAIPWHVIPVFRYWYVNNLTPGTSVAAAYFDGRPAILTRSIGQGRVLVMTTPVSDPPTETAWNQLPTSPEAAWLFVMLSDGMTQFLLGNGEKNLNYQTGQTAVLRPNVSQFPASCMIQPPTGNAIRASTDSLRRRIVYPAVNLPGNYAVFDHHSRTGMSRFTAGFSAVVPPQTWDLTRMNREQIQSLFGDHAKIEHVNIETERHHKKTGRSREEMGKVSSLREIGVSRSQTGREFFPLLLVLILGVFLTEYAVANQFYRE